MCIIISGSKKMIKIYENSSEFLLKYEQYLSGDEIRYGLILGISKRNKGITLILSSEIEDRFVLGVLAGKNLILASNTLNTDVYYDLVKYMDNVEYPGIIGTNPAQ